MDTLYVSRALDNTEEVDRIRAELGVAPPQWAPHVQLTYSDRPVAWEQDDVQPDTNRMVIEGGEKQLARFGDSLVVLLPDERLTQRWSTLQEAGASHGFPQYDAHMTIGLDPEHRVDLSQTVRFNTPLVFSGETRETMDGRLEPSYLREEPNARIRQGVAQLVTAANHDGVVMEMEGPMVSFATQGDAGFIRANAAWSEESPHDLRAVALDAQATLLESQGPKVVAMATSLRALGPSQEAVAFGLDLVEREVGFEGQQNRRLAHLLPYHLAQRDSVQLGALGALVDEDYKAGWSDRGAGLEERKAVAYAYYAGQDTPSVQAASVASQKMVTSMLLNTSTDRHEKMTLLAVRDLLDATPTTQAVRPVLEGIAAKEVDGHPRVGADHPVVVVMEASGAVARERSLAPTNRAAAGTER